MSRHPKVRDPEQLPLGPGRPLNRLRAPVATSKLVDKPTHGMSEVPCDADKREGIVICLAAGFARCLPICVLYYKMLPRGDYCYT